MAQAILLSLLAGLGSALLSGVLSPLSQIASVLFIIAPLPLLIVGLGWHPLLAALGALLACLLMSMGLGHRAAIAYGLIVGAPSWLLCEITIRLFGHSRALTPGDAARRIGIVVTGATVLGAAVCFLAALSLDFDHDRLETRLATALSQTLRALVAGETLPRGVDIDRFAAIYVNILPPLFTAVLSIMFTLSLWLAVRVARKSERLPFEAPPLFLTQMPKGSLAAFAVCLLLAQAPDWPGFIGVIGAAALSVGFVVSGIAVLHMKTLGRPERPVLLAVVWLVLLVFVFAAIGFLLLGALDTIFDFRRLRAGSSNPSN